VAGGSGGGSGGGVGGGSGGGPAQLTFSAEPGTAAATNLFPVSPVVAIQDASGNTLASSTVAVTVALLGPGGTQSLALSGSTTVNAVAGVATFNTLRIATPGNGYVLVASAVGLSANSTAFDVVATNCAAGGAAEVFNSNMQGCAGSVPFSNRASLCAASAHVCKTDEWTNNASSKAPSNIYWTDDALRYSSAQGACGTSACASGQCFVSSGAGGFDGGALTTAAANPMRVCSGSSDSQGNGCEWTGCGNSSVYPDARFGGNPDSSASGQNAGALCCAGTTHLWYVDADAGSDALDAGTLAHPFQSLTHAVSVATSGQTILVNPGAYSPPGYRCCALNPPLVGNQLEQFPIVVPAGVALLGNEVGQGTTNGLVSTAVYGEIIVGAGAVVTGVASVESLFQTTKWNGIVVAGANGTVRNNFVVLQDAGIDTTGATDYLVALNTFEGNLTGLHSQSASSGRIENNVFRQNEVGIELQAAGPDVGTVVNGAVPEGDSVGNNVLSCNVVSFATDAGGTLHLDNDQWDHAPPAQSSSSSTLDLDNTGGATLSLLDPRDAPYRCGICSSQANGTQYYNNTMAGCSGAVSFANAASLCNVAAGCHVCSAAEYSTNYGGVVPSEDYWTSNALNRNGTANSCSATVVDSISNCGAGNSMLVCIPAADTPDDNGNTCAWTGCAFSSAGVSGGDVPMGGCASPNTGVPDGGATAGAVCCCP